nr:hypothetical protein [Tanacetum cinerariifolium]GFB02032.1 hypothetical protein [Tanacetum cinerariifolium]
MVSVPPAAEVSTISVPTGSGMVSTASLIFTTASVVTPYSRRKGKEKMVESDTPKKKKLQKQIDVQVEREMEEQLAREDQRRDEQIARDAKIAKVHAKEELQMLIDGLDRNNETVAKYLQEENLNQLWTLVKETLNIRQAAIDKEKELWVKLKRLYKPNVQDQLWTQTQALMNDLVEWRLYDTCGVHYGRIVRNKMLKAFPPPMMSSHCQKTFPLLVKKGSPAE